MILTQLSLSLFKMYLYLPKGWCQSPQDKQGSELSPVQFWHPNLGTGCRGLGCKGVVPKLS